MCYSRIYTRTNGLPGREIGVYFQLNIGKASTAPLPAVPSLEWPEMSTDRTTWNMESKTLN